ncbi:LacI family DNA-binding transcriptional regulator [Prosthecomicrobium pneumaticum]|uniref:DNA-binding LacI/PurR family transcriptional regulator n=1 Tax=Prosthecomicrobium pneumaticum TaxID=81895 RepID=A0A7W9FJB8_9HYPH|nr:LacI family DNA-binding transcriptional regulator [Prosthecomicrobium pneumaticum]MBB5751557.1 DNA-binding LacI/PurR family transcriptional regulator [Prosthecomicrobium pneumaticum]
MGSRRATLSDIARLAGVSRSLASLAIRGEGPVNAETRKRIMAAAAQLDYRPNLVARSLASADAKYLGIVVGEIENPLQAEIAKIASLLAREHGYSALVSIDADTDENAEEAIRTLIAHRVSGVLAIGAPFEKPAIAEVAGWIPMVYVGRLLKIVAVDAVTTDDISGGRLAVDHLVQLGHRRIAHIDGGASPGAERRRSGYRDGMAAHGLDRHIRVVAGAYTIDAGAAGARALLADSEWRPTAVFASNDMAAIGLINEALRLGLSVPGDLSVVGYDDVTLAGTETLSLTTIHQSARDLATSGIKAMMERLAAPDAPVRKVLVPPRLVARRSTGAASAKSAA